VKVKALTWHDYYAETPFGSYTVSESSSDSMWHWQFNSYPYGEPSYNGFLTDVEARVAAQADYEARIRSALLPVSPVPLDAGLVGGQSMEHIAELAYMLRDRYAGALAGLPVPASSQLLEAAMVLEALPVALRQPATQPPLPISPIEANRSGQWSAFSQVLDYLNTLETKVIEKKAMYAAVMDMRPALPVPPDKRESERFKELLAQERALSDAYLRLREMIPGAFDTPHAPTAEQVWAHTEKCLTALIAPRTPDNRIGELELSLSHANDVVHLEREARKAAEAHIDFLLNTFVPELSAWQDKRPDHAESGVYKQTTIGDIRKARAALRSPSAAPAGETKL